MNKIILVILVSLFLASCDLEVERTRHEIIQKNFMCMMFNLCG